MHYRIICVGLAFAFFASTSKGEVWPEKSWIEATPASQGMSGKKLDELAAYALKHGGGSGCVIRHGYLVKEWGSANRRADIKSATKGSVGITLLGLAVGDKLVGIDDLAKEHYPKIGLERSGNKKEWIDKLTVRQLATMTAGFDNGRPPKLVYEPGSNGIYSNDTSNMLAELLTLKYRKDLKDVLTERVMKPLNVDPKRWTWRANSYRKKTVGGFVSREFASGIRITHRELARIGYLYLRKGRWKNRGILSEEFVRLATTPTKLPGPWPYYALYWGSNGLGNFDGMPKDAFWAMGLGDSFVLVCPSLDIVAVRLGTGSHRSRLPGSGKPNQWGDNWGGRVGGFGSILRDAVQKNAPRDPVPVGIRWAPKESIVRLAKGSDNWPNTWADDGHLYTAYGDGNGFRPKVSKKLSLGLARVEGNPPEIKGINIRAPTVEQFGGGASGKKAGGLLMVDGVLYMLVRNAANAQLAWSEDRGKTWKWATWKFERSFGCPTFLQFGKNYSGALDEYVYVYSHDADSAYKPADRMVLARVSKKKIRRADAYEFFVKLDAKGKPIWSSKIDERGAVLTSKGKCYRSGVSFNPGMKRYLWCQTLPGKDARFRGGFSIYHAEEPWGPWRVLFTTPLWDVGPGETSSIPPKWISEDGISFYLLFSGEDAFSVRKGTFLFDKD